MSIDLLISIGFIVASLLILVKGADLFSDFAEKLALYFKVPPFIIGVTIIAFGTSLPELFSSITAASQGIPQIALGDIIGSNITNVFLVLGLGTFLLNKKVVKISYDLIHVDLPFFVGSAFIAILILLDGKTTVFESLILIAGLLLYIMYSISIRKEKHSAKLLAHLRKEHPRKSLNGESFLWGIAGLVFLILGAKYFISNIVEITEELRISIEWISISLVPLSSNLPELSVVIRNAMKGKSELVVGNVLGSNIFNIFGVMGISSLFGQLTATNGFFLLALPALAMATILYFFITQENQITKWEGGLLILAYLVYLNLTYSVMG